MPARGIVPRQTGTSLASHRQLPPGFHDSTTRDARFNDTPLSSHIARDRASNDAQTSLGAGRDTTMKQVPRMESAFPGARDEDIKPRREPRESMSRRTYAVNPRADPPPPIITMVKPPISEMPAPPPRRPSFLERIGLSPKSTTSKPLPPEPRPPPVARPEVTRPSTSHVRGGVAVALENSPYLREPGTSTKIAISQRAANASISPSQLPSRNAKVSPSTAPQAPVGARRSTLTSHTHPSTLTSSANSIGSASSMRSSSKSRVGTSSPSRRSSDIAVPVSVSRSGSLGRKSSTVAPTSLRASAKRLHTGTCNENTAAQSAVFASVAKPLRTSSSREQIATHSSSITVLSPTAEQVTAHRSSDHVERHVLPVHNALRQEEYRSEDEPDSPDITRSPSRAPIIFSRPVENEVPLRRRSSQGRPGADHLSLTLPQSRVVYTANVGSPLDDSTQEALSSSQGHQPGSSLTSLDDGGARAGRYKLVNDSVVTIGLRNLGNTCFMNSIVQCTLATEYLVSYFAQGEWESDINSNARRGSTAKGKMAQAFSSLFNETCTRTSSTAISPNIFYRTVCSLYPQFSGYSQHDAQEFLRCILDGLHEDLRVPPTKPSKTYSEAEVDSWSDEKKARYSWDRFRKDGSSIILDLFGGLLHSSITCHRCKYRSSTFDFFMDLSVPIPQSGNDERPLLSFSRRSRSQKPVSLRECLDEFTADEILDGSEAYNCAKCKKPVKATKRLRVCKAPDLLVIHLKRFAYDTYSGEKIENVVDFPFSNLRIDNIMSDIAGPDVSPPSPVYDLYAVCGHSGSLHGGHYVAYTKSLSPYPPLPGSQQSSVHSLVESSAPLASPWTPDSPALPALRETWHLCNDSYVSPVNKAEAVSGAYVLFYKRRR